MKLHTKSVREIGATATIIWNDGHISKDYYFSFEDFPENTDPDTYILPLANIPDYQVFMYCTKTEFLKMKNGEFVDLKKELEVEFRVLEYRFRYA